MVELNGIGLNSAGLTKYAINDNVCFQYLVSERSDEINQCYDENYPLHQCTLHDIKFLELLIQCGAVTTVRTSTQQMTALHVLLLQGKKSAEDTLQV